MHLFPFIVVNYINVRNRPLSILSNELLLEKSRCYRRGCKVTRSPNRNHQEDKFSSCCLAREGGLYIYSRRFYSPGEADVSALH